ncbi:Uncharacterised protein [Serratia entomophila]|uniref:hypothetical protein n=1 Tax=Serratia entomophila TaxID=42906 RepID=UPI001F479240|nr:hypothetical protein [Serratia entomophila]CAI0822681.1 Uncharacterised protein [Serratia entomophila]CAI0825660.1 Uncharacterised protein [Serratia entomophila]CAI0846366.1 Uncharacterised protein [Serratia entomophila]CAI0875844.1 Uncharacterised protein [Serratia entomophila]CAI1028679.1 Uncharacterised protein [Serratia entomophila]
MTQTLTTEQLRARAAHLRAKAGQWRDIGHAGKANRLMSDAAAFEELATNREAQPVAYMNKFSGVCMTLEQQPNAADDADVYVPLYATPPAPAVPEYDILEDYRAEMLKRADFGGDGHDD